MHKLEDEMEEAVLEYLASHPQAADTIVGIADWWITQRQIRPTVKALQVSLDRLIKRGILETIGDNAQRCYRLKGGFSRSPPE